MYIGIDIGYSSVKLCYGAGPHPSQQQLPVGAAPKSRMMKGMNGETLVGQGHLVMVNDEEWVAGINPEDIQGFVRIMDKQYPETKEYLALYRAALSRVGVAKVDRAVIGLPMFQFLDEEARAKLRERLKGRHYIRPGFTVDVVDVMVIPQPAGALAAHMVAQGKLDRSEQIRPNELALVVDPGHFSIDWVAYRRGFKTDAAGSTQTAGEVIVQAAARELSTEHGAKVYAEDLERAILDGATTVAAGKKDVSYQAALEYQAERIIDANLRVIRASVRQLDDGQGLKVILITGGSAKLFEVPLTKAFPQSRIVVVKDSVMANARGFYQTALMQQGNQSAA